MAEVFCQRGLVPWGVAVIIYAAVSGWHLSPSLFLELVLRPPFHLWYVPVLFFLICATWALPFPPLLLLALGTPFSLTIMYMFGLSHGPVFMDYGRQIAVSSATPSISSLACWLRKISCRAAISPVPCCSPALALCGGQVFTAAAWSSPIFRPAC